VCAFLLERDGYPAIPAHIALTTGAPEGVEPLAPALTSALALTLTLSPTLTLSLTVTLTLTLSLSLSLSLARRLGGREALHRRAGAHGA